MTPATSEPAPLPLLQLLLAAQTTMWARAQQLTPGWLTEAEQNRLATMQHPARRQEFVACRYALRHLLVTTADHTPDYWRLDAPEGSAPRLNTQHHGVHAAASTHLSLSHSGTYLACAVAPESVGVDVEVKDVRAAKRDLLALAAMACTDEEIALLQAIGDEALRYRHFLQIWSLKEAYFKCVGMGVDFSVIRRLQCCPAALLPPLQGPVLARARSWQGTTATGLAVLLSACVVSYPDGAMLPYALEASGADIAWDGDSEWCLVALPG